MNSAAHIGGIVGRNRGEITGSNRRHQRQYG